jgi:molybdate transport system ATP-binding protein
MLLDQLQVVASGDKAQVMASQAWRDVFPPLPPLPDTLPARDPSLPDSTPSLDQPAIEAHNLCASFQGVKVLDNIDLILRPGEHIAIRGPNGCGKSTLLNLLSGENHKAYGQDLKLFGRARGSGETLWQVKAHFGVVSNQVQAKYIRGWNALEVVISGFYHSVGLYRSFGVHERQAAMDWLHALQLQHLAMQHFATLSYGQQRMVLLARAMVTYPPILVLDEPCTGLDDYNRQWLLRMVDFIAANSNTQVMFVSHLADEVPTCINREMEFIPRKDGLYQLVARGAKTR